MEFFGAQSVLFACVLSLVNLCADEYISWRNYHRFLYSCLSGVIGAQSVLFAKTFAELSINFLDKTRSGMSCSII